MGLLSQIQAGKTRMPPRLFIYGTEGIGKSTLAASAPDAIFIQTEDGLGEIDCHKFPLARTPEDVEHALVVEPHQDPGGDHPRGRRDQADAVRAEHAGVVLEHDALVAVHDDEPGAVETLLLHVGVDGLGDLPEVPFGSRVVLTRLVVPAAAAGRRDERGERGSEEPPPPRVALRARRGRAVV